MKSIVIIIPFVLVTSFLYAQRPRQITIQKVKESHKIDSLLESARNKTDTAEKYFCFEIAKFDNDYSVNLFQIMSNSSQVLLPPLNLADLTFFEWHHYTIFVAEDKNTFHLFKKVNSWKSFAVGEPEHDLGRQERMFFGTYRYTNGKFKRYDIVAY